MQTQAEAFLKYWLHTMPWNDVECHPNVKKNILASIHEGKMKGTYLIHGPTNAGQIAIARAIAMSLNCKNASEDFCGNCLNCRRIHDHQFPDVFEMQPNEDWEKPERKGQDYSIGHMRIVQEYAQNMPYEGAMKIFIFNDAHRMTIPAANSLLKILEEPHEHLLFLMLTDNFSKILPTILSRCHKIRLTPLDIHALANTLAEKLPPQAAETLARASGGLPQVARSLFAENYLEERDEILQHIKDIRTRISAIPELAELYSKKERDEIREDLAIFLNLLRDGLLIVEGIEDGCFYNPDRKEELKQIWYKDTPQSIFSAIEKILDVIEGMDRYLNLRVQFTDLFFSLQPPENLQN